MAARPTRPLRVRLTLAALAALAMVAFTAAADAQPRPARTQARIGLRTEAHSRGLILARIPRNRAVRVFGCAQGWCTVRYRDIIGFADQSELAIAPLMRASPSRNHGYTSSRGAWVSSPRAGADGLAPDGASARCRDGTFSFSVSRSGTCSHHGGVARWLD